MTNTELRVLKKKQNIVNVELKVPNIEKYKIIIIDKYRTEGSGKEQNIVKVELKVPNVENYKT